MSVLSILFANRANSDGTTPNWYQRITALNAFAVWMLIVLGGIVRVTESGTGCGASWPKCNGRWIPPLEFHAMVEWNHRLFAVLVGFLMLFTVLSTLLWFRKPRRLLVFALLAAVSYIAQAILGALTVIFEVGHGWVAAHMGNSMILMGSTILLALFARIGAVPISEKSGWLKWFAIATLIWTYIALFSGSAVIGEGADIACPAWPHCSDANILPQNYLQWVNFGHRLAVGVADILMLLLAIGVWRKRRGDRLVMSATHILAIFYVSQVFIGAFTIWTKASPAMKGLHLAVAAATWAALVVLVTLIWVGEPQASKIKKGSKGLSRRVFSRVPEPVRAYFALMKPRIIPLLLVPTIAAMLIAAVQHPPQGSLLGLMFWTVLGGILATGGAHSINNFLDRDIDAKMRRTRNRPVVTGRVSPERALWFGIFLSILALVEMWVFVNPVAAVLAILGNLFYVFVYTAWLKRTTTQNIVIGGAAGAVPPLVGWAAVTGDVGLPAILFFAIIFFWTPAHFWSLALVRQEDYKAAGIPMLPVVKGQEATMNGILKYAVLLLLSTILPFLTHSLGYIYLVVAISLGMLLVIRAIQLKLHPEIALAWKVFKYSNIYLAMLYAAMVIDRLIALR